MTTIHTRQLTKYIQENQNNTYKKTNNNTHKTTNNNTHKTTNNNIHKTTTTIHTRELTTIHTRQLQQYTRPTQQQLHTTQLKTSKQYMRDKLEYNMYKR